ncbi:MAG: phosphopantothenoylcysteine decarboxylase/phosphopantothenate--cysteine ligase [Pseudohongiellaceae bacterium]|jgi:phosphopantothenoylcysteine decarboxylase/phosphopantothenate--cysteine ligase
MLSLSNKRILLGITGGIAAYKCAELTRLFAKAGADVRVVMTKAATEFVTPLTMQALSGNRVHLDLLDVDAEAGMGHIELARWADLILIAPATANSMAKLANGRADDLLTTLVLAASAPVALAPAMNQGMWADQSTQANLVTLQQRGFLMFGPAAGEQACGDVGLGRMLEPLEIAEACASLFQVGHLAGKHVVITGGPTREPLDPVRFLTNHSSGKMAYALAQEAHNAGARVTLISGPVNLFKPDGVTRIDVTTASEMFKASLAAVVDADIFIGVAAVADYRPAKVETKKIKKNSDQLEVTLIRNPDIISEISKLPKRPFMVGFAAETENLIENGTAKLEKKNLDLLFANNAVETFNSDCIKVTAISKQGCQEFPASNKNVAARSMLSLISKRST